MSQLPSIYRQPGNLYPENSVILTHTGTFPIEIEHYLGKAGADSAYVLKNEELKNYYSPFFRFHAKSKEYYVDYTKPKTLALYATFIYPITLGKGIVKENQGSVHRNRHSLVPFLSLIAGVFSFVTGYLVTHDILRIRNSKRVLLHTEQIRSFLKFSKNSDYNTFRGPDYQAMEPVYHGIEKVLCLREKIYKRNLVSAIIGIALSILIAIAATAAIVGLAVSVSPLLITSVVVLGVAALAFVIKIIAEANSRQDIPNLQTILQHTEILRKILPPYDERMKQLEVLGQRDREISNSLKSIRRSQQVEMLRKSLELEQQNTEHQYEEMQFRELQEKGLV